jgi:hypothetical protein
MLLLKYEWRSLVWTQRLTTMIRRLSHHKPWTQRLTTVICRLSHHKPWTQRLTTMIGRLSHHKSWTQRLTTMICRLSHHKPWTGHYRPSTCLNTVVILPLCRKSMYTRWQWFGKEFIVMNHSTGTHASVWNCDLVSSWPNVLYACVLRLNRCQEREFFILKAWNISEGWC